MNILHSTSSFTPLKPSSLLSPPSVHSPLLYTFGCYPKIRVQTSHSIEFPLTSPNPSHALRFSCGASIPSNQGTVSVVHFEDFVEKDWSFLDTDNTNTDGEHMQKIDRIISAGNIEETSKVLVSIGSEAFVDRVVDSSPCEQLLVVHESLLILACIKEKYDKVKCWQGELINVPEKWTSFDVVFLYFLPALPFELNQVLAALAKRCLPGARLVISHPQGRQVVEEQQQQYPDVVVSNLPEETTLQSTAADHSFEVVEFVDEPGFYLAVLRLNVE
ncbi:hypothetical protein Pfo_029605 [Paulownia fortunei]|nr:hypothetical protein Pfo_028164 [Paulownia fortunei]KAI3472117.1 hypothetical protein Pfo_029605 [Paulownia fortunei]